MLLEMFLNIFLGIVLVLMSIVWWLAILGKI